MSYARSVRFHDRSTPPHVITLVLIAAVNALSMNIFLPSLPQMTDWFETDYAVMQLSVSLFLGINAALQMVVGPISDWFGRRPVLIGSFIIFMLATLGCLFAPTIEIFLIFRMCQAVVAAGMVLSRAIVRDVVPMNQAASMIGYVSMGMALVPMVAPILGGFLDEQFGWKANFWAMMLFGALVLYLTVTDLGETMGARQPSFRRQFAGYPALLTSYRFWGYALSAGFASGSFFAYLGGAPKLALESFRLSPSQMGLFFGAPAVGYMVGNGLSGRFSARWGINRMILWGMILTSAGLITQLTLYLLGLAPAVVFFCFFAFLGLGNGMVMPNANAGVISLRPELAGSASGLGGAIMIGSGAALSAFAGWLMGGATSPVPLLLVMLCTSFAGLAAVLVVLRRERQLAAAGRE